jgi:uncharacterized protein (DUF1330 family)
MVSGRHAGFKHSADTIQKISEARRAKPLISRYVSTDGYIMVYCPEHPQCNPKGYVREHRLAMEKKCGRHLSPKESVHHIDFNKQNNAESNLILFPSNNAHRKYHEKLKRDKLALNI